jgi:hypothetical protein
VRLGYVSVAAARELYRAAAREDGSVEEAATAALRQGTAA